MHLQYFQIRLNDQWRFLSQKTPFANTTTNSELGMFYREWQTAPPLKTFTDLPPLSEQVQDLSKQLENYESDMKQYDDVLQSLIQSPNNN